VRDESPAVSERSQMTDLTKATCPPHHWQVTAVHGDESSYEHHHCLRCGAQKDAPTPESPSMFWDRVDPPERYARSGRRG
jgi:hypothetical protein